MIGVEGRSLRQPNDQTKATTMNSHTKNPDLDPDDIEEEAGDDAEGHAVNATSDDNDDGGGDDAEGHRAYSSNVGANFD